MDSRPGKNLNKFCVK